MWRFFDDITFTSILTAQCEKEVETIPVTAFREAVANTLVHRAWDMKAHARISLHPDKVEIVSPGGLPIRDRRARVSS